MTDFAKLKAEIEAQIDFLSVERLRAKAAINSSGYNCTSAPYMLYRDYSDAIKRHIKVLLDNLEDL